MRPVRPRLTEVKPGIFVITWPGDRMIDGWGANQGFVITAEGVVVIDSGFTGHHASHILDTIKKHTRKRILAVINTHDHSDHIFGNSFFAAQGGLTIGHSECRERVMRLGPERMKRYRNDPTLNKLLGKLSICPPMLTYSHEMDLHLNGALLKLLHPSNGGHTTGDTLVLLPHEKVLFAGDIFWNRYHANLEDANFKGWLSTLEKITRMDLDIVVPGHGEPADTKRVQSFREYLVSILETFAKIKTKGLSDREMLSALIPRGTETWRLKSIILHNIQKLRARN